VHLTVNSLFVSQYRSDAGTMKQSSEHLQDTQPR